MMGDDTPFSASLLEDSRFAEAAVQMFGNVLGYIADAKRYVGNTSWHYDGSSYDDLGVHFVMYLQPVRVHTGALRVIPGSHKRPWFDQLDERPPLRYAWARKDFSRAEASELIDSIPSHVCETDPGDMLAFDWRLYHATLGGSDDRHQLSLDYSSYPRTPQEVALMIAQAKAYLIERDNTTDPWNPKRGATDEWLANPDGNPRRQRWIYEWKKFSEMIEGENGFKTRGMDGKLKVVSV